MTAVVKGLLDERGLSQRELARRMGLSVSRVTERMRGEARWTLDDTFAVADALGIDPTALTDKVARHAQNLGTRG
ncbi:MAG: helix-turn-helix transcriptional regulator [Propionibacteriaceae bacterium]|nr:helix-turn-helix transcriptional regulator [Propionibacteriaceae bacterium]